MVGRQINVIHLKARVCGRVDAHGQRQQSDGQHRLLLADKGQCDEGDHRNVQTDAVEQLSRHTQLHCIALQQGGGDVAEHDAHHCHYQVGKGGQEGVLWGRNKIIILVFEFKLNYSHLFNVKIKHSLHVTRDLGQQSPEAPIVGAMDDGERQE